MKKQLLNLLLANALFASAFAQPVSIDTTFNTAKGFDNFINDIAVQNDGKIIAVGYFDNFNDTAAARIIRLNSDGSKDHSFNTGIGFPEQVACVKLDGNGKIYVGGGFYSYNGNSIGRIVRINDDGSMDQNFNSSPGFNDYVRSINFDDNNNIIAAGNFTTYSSDSAKYIARLLSDGQLDTTFKAELDGYATNAVVLSNGKIMVLGGFTKVNGKNRNLIALLNSDGTLDESFNAGNIFTMEMKECIELNGKYLVGGYFGNYTLLNANGTVDNSFTKPSGSNSAMFNTIVQQPNGKILLGGNFSSLGSSSSSNFNRVESGGSLDNIFINGSGFSGEVKKIITVGDTLIYVAGAMTAFNGKDIKRLVRLTTKVNAQLSVHENYTMNISLFPNPVSDVVNINLNGTSNIVVLDAASKVVMNFNTASSQIDLSSLNQGIYFLQVFNNQETKTAKIIKN